MRDGFITLIAVIVFSALLLSMSVSFLLFATDRAHTNRGMLSGARAAAAADACAEEALLSLRGGIGESSLSLSLPDGSCTATVSRGQGNRWEVRAQGMSGGAVFRSEMTVRVQGNGIWIESWDRVESF